jgi:hypothetical protein
MQGIAALRGACTKVRGRRLAHSNSHKLINKSIIEEEINPVA